MFYVQLLLAKILKVKNRLLTWLSFGAFGICVRKSCSKRIDEIDPRSVKLTPNFLLSSHAWHDSDFSNFLDFHLLRYSFLWWPFCTKLMKNDEKIPDPTFSKRKYEKADLLRGENIYPTECQFDFAFQILGKIKIVQVKCIWNALQCGTKNNNCTVLVAIL